MMTVGETFRLIFLRTDSTDLRRRRLIGLAQGLITSLGNKVIGVLVSFLSVPLTIGYLGPERYGIWVTIGTLLAWLSLTDFGIGLGLNTAVTSAVGQDRPDLVRDHVTTALVVLSAVAGGTGIVMVLAWPWIDWSVLFGAKTALARAEVGPAMAAAIAISLLQFPLSVIDKVYVAYQEGRIANYWGACGNILSLGVLLLVTQTQGGLIWLVIAMSGTGLFMRLANGIWLFSRHRPYLSPKIAFVKRSSVKALGHVGSMFFLIQIMALVMFQTDNFVISHFLGADKVPSYSLTYSLFGYTSLIQNMLFSYLWSAYAEAIARKDIPWVRRTYHLNLAFSTASTLLMAIALTFIAQAFIAWWAGSAVVPDKSLVYWMAVWAVVNAYTNPIACLFAAAAHLRAQTIYSGIATVSNIALSVLLVQTWGVTGVIAGTVISYLIFICAPMFIDAQFLLKKLERST